MQEKEGISMTIPAEHAGNLFGELDENLRHIEKALHVEIVPRGDSVKIYGSAANTGAAQRLIENLLRVSENGTHLTPESVDYAMSLLHTHKEKAIVEMDRDVIIHTALGRPVKPKTVGQKQYVDMIREHMITFGIGPAGTGKTYLAMAMAIAAFQNEDVQRIILTRPALEAGEKLGFLPGDLQSKIDPYLRPLYDALYQIMGAENFQKNLEKGLIEVAPLAYMRGRTLDNAFIILDEAQNTTPSQMKMFLTRIGFGSKAVVTGDRTQKDLPREITSGLAIAERVLAKIPEIGFMELTSRDVVRHPLVQKIVDAYEKYEEKAAQAAPRRKEESHDDRYRKPGKRNG